MNYEKINYMSAALMIEYTKILREVFPGVVLLREFAKTFNELGFVYAGYNKHKLDPVSIMRHEISCSSTAMLMGLSEVIQNHLQPAYLVEKMTLDDLWLERHNPAQRKTRAHTMVQSNVEGTPEYWEMWSKDSGSRECIVVQVTNPKFLQGLESIQSTRKFFANRVQVFEVNKAALAGAEKYREVIKKYAQNENEFLEYLREQYAANAFD